MRISDWSSDVCSSDLLVLAGKTHVMVDHDGLERLNLDGGSELGRLLSTGGFEEIDRYDGHHEPGQESGYPAYLRRHGYVSDDPWTDFVISAKGPDGKPVSGRSEEHTSALQSLMRSSYAVFCLKKK